MKKTYNIIDGLKWKKVGFPVEIKGKCEGREKGNRRIRDCKLRINSSHRFLGLIADPYINYFIN